MMWKTYGSARQATDGNVIWSMQFVCLITRANDTRSEHVICTAFPLQQWLYESAPECYIAHKLLVLFKTQNS